MPLRHWLQLTLTHGLGPILIQRLVQAAGSAENACSADLALLRSIEGIGQAKASSILSSLRAAADEAESEWYRTQTARIRLLCPDDTDYPILLRSIPDPPPVLYMRGSLEARDLNALAIVGSRNCSHYGREQADRFAALLAGAGITVISGGARGIDSAAHRGALSHPQGRTIAVLGSGVDTPYPPENSPLFDLIAQHGAILSEYPLGTAPLAENFPRRNRIVSGLSRGTLVVEARQRSGALITARQACDDHGRPVFALPGRVDNPLSEGPHQLIRDGAILVTNLQDILDGLDPLPHDVHAPTLFDDTPPEPSESPSPSCDLSDRQRLILSHMSGDPASVDFLVEQTALPAQVILQELTFLSLKGLARRVDGQTYARRSKGSP